MNLLMLNLNYDMMGSLSDMNFEYEVKEGEFGGIAAFLGGVKCAMRFFT